MEQEFTAEEIRVLEGSQQQRRPPVLAPVRTLAEAVRVIARLGGHLGRKGDGPPGRKFCGVVCEACMTESKVTKSPSPNPRDTRNE